MISSQDQEYMKKFDLYNRQGSIDLNHIKKAVVIGCGGIGSHMALRFAMLGVQEIVLIDYDTVEYHNLNRTFFEDMHVGMNKARAMAEIIKSKRAMNTQYLYKTIMTQEIENLGLLSDVVDMSKLIDEGKGDIFSK